MTSFTYRGAQKAYATPHEAMTAYEAEINEAKRCEADRLHRERVYQRQLSDQLTRENWEVERTRLESMRELARSGPRLEPSRWSGAPFPAATSMTPWSQPSVSLPSRVSLQSPNQSSPLTWNSNPGDDGCPRPERTEVLSDVDSGVTGQSRRGSDRLGR